MRRSGWRGAKPKGPLRDNAPALAVLFGAHMVGSMTFITFATMASFIREDLSLSATQFGFLVSCYFAAQGILALPIGATIDRIGVRNSLALANLTLFSGALMLALATGMAGALAGMAVLGIGYCFVNPSTSKAVFELFPAQRLGTAMGIKQTGVPIGGVVGATVGGLAGTFDWRWLMAGVGLSALFFAASALLLGRPRDNAAKNTASLGTHLRNMRQVIADRNLAIFNVASGFYQAGQANLFSYITLFARETMHASQPMAASCLGIAQLASASGRMTWGMVSDVVFRGRRRPVLVIMATIAVLGLLLFAVMTRSWTVAAVIPVAIILGLTVSGHVALVQTVVVEMANPAYTATSVAYNRLFVSLGASIGPPLFGVAVDYSGGYGAGWLVTAGLVFIALLLFACVFRERDREQA